jgi:hypothetical protein
MIHASFLREYTVGKAPTVVKYKDLYKAKRAKGRVCTRVSIHRN